MTELFERAYNGSYYTIIGCGGDLNDWKNGYNKMLNEQGIGTPTEWIEFTGKDMNEVYGLVGDNAYQDDLHFLSFPLDGLNIGKLAMFRMITGDMWFDDVVDNNRRRNDT